MENTFTATELLTYANLQIAAETLYGKLKDPAGNPSKRRVGNLLPTRFNGFQAA